MKRIQLPTEKIEVDGKKHSAKDLLEDVIMVRQAWRTGDGPKQAMNVFAALDKVDAGVFVVPDKEWGTLVAQAQLDPGTQITPRAANRLFLKLAKALADAEEQPEDPSEEKDTVEHG